MRQQERVERVALADEAQGGARLERREQVEQVLELAGFLSPEDTFLIRQVLGHGLKMSDIARQSGVPRAAVWARLHAAVRRMRTPEFRFVVRRGSRLSPTVWRTADLVFCKGFTRQEAARRTCRSVYAVRQDLHLVRALARRNAKV